MRAGFGAVAAAAMAALVANSAQAHSPYLLPNAFDATGRDHVTVEASLTEHFFTPDIALKSDDFHAIGPDGTRVALTPTYMKDLALLELSTPGDGTWRISTGARLGRTGKAAIVDGAWVFQTDRKPLPPGAAPFEVRSIACSEVYVSRGAPGDAALAPTGQGLEFHALTHPDKISAGEPARFELLLDGKPLAGQPVALHRGDEAYAEGKPLPEVVSDGRGRFSVTAPTPGVYVAMTRYRQPPVGADPARNLTYALTFEAIR